jgi:proteic killer suppression protein
MFLPKIRDWPPARILDARPVNLAFETLALRTLCECQSKAECALGIKPAARLRERLADIRAAEAVTDLVAGRPREIEGGRHRHYAVDLANGYRLVFCANHVRIPVIEMDRVDWSRVTRVKLLKIEVGHG